jgi:small subunit ribosomal protein S17
MARKLQGTIVSAKMQKTVVVAVHRIKAHPKYGKRFRVDTRYKAHVENGEWRVGDVVAITETRPISKDKRWLVSELVKRPESEEELKEA